MIKINLGKDEVEVEISGDLGKVIAERGLCAFEIMKAATKNGVSLGEIYKRMEEELQDAKRSREAEAKYKSVEEKEEYIRGELRRILKDILK